MMKIFAGFFVGFARFRGFVLELPFENLLSLSLQTISKVFETIKQKFYYDKESFLRHVFQHLEYDIF